MLKLWSQKQQTTKLPKRFSFQHPECFQRLTSLWWCFFRLVPCFDPSLRPTISGISWFNFMTDPWDQRWGSVGAITPKKTPFISVPHRIRVWYIYIHEWLTFIVHVGKNIPVPWILWEWSDQWVCVFCLATTTHFQKKVYRPQNHWKRSGILNYSWCSFLTTT